MIAGLVVAVRCGVYVGLFVKVDGWLYLDSILGFQCGLLLWVV